MEVLYYVYAAFCVLAVIAGALEVRRSAEQHWEVRAGLFGLLLLCSLIFLTTVDWEKVFRVCGAIGIALFYVAGIVLGCKPSPVKLGTQRVKVPVKKVDYTMQGENFLLSGYEDRNGNPVHFT